MCERSSGPVINDWLSATYISNAPRASDYVAVRDVMSKSRASFLAAMCRRLWVTLGYLCALTCIDPVYSPLKAEVLTRPDGRLPLGTIYTPRETSFSIWSPDTSDVKLVLEGISPPIPMTKIPDTDEYTDVYRVTVPGDQLLKRYHFELHGNAVRDPYGVMVEPGTNNDIVMDLSATSPEGGWVTPPALAQREDAVIYELNIHDYTADQSSGVSAGNRGKFLGLVEHGSRVQGRPTGIDHLVDLGVTHVQIMPMFDHSACPPDAPPTCYSWGYDPTNYNVPEERYSAFAGTEYVNRIRELKAMVNEFHKSGIRVVMDVVYNHVPLNDDIFGGITNKYFLPQDISGAGRSLDAGVPMVNRMIRDSLEYWVREYNVDGFRFDLMGVFRYINLYAWAKYLNTLYPERKLLLYGEPYAATGVSIPEAMSGSLYDADQVRLGNLAFIADSHVGAFNVKYRDAIRGGNLDGGATGGYMFNQGDAFGEIRPGSRGSIRFSNTPYQPLDPFDRMFAARPGQSINFVGLHDNLCLRDRIIQWAKEHGQSDNTGYLARIQEFGAGIVLTSQGIPFLSEGDEFLRDKDSVADVRRAANSFNASDPVNTIHWGQRVQNEEVYNYFKQTIALRRSHPGFRMMSWEAIDRNIRTSVPRDDVVVNWIESAATGDTWKEIVVIYNSGSGFTLPLPNGTWNVAMERSQPVDHERSVTLSVTAEGTAVTVVYYK